MAQDNVLGIQATINGKDIKQGADEFISQVGRMEQAADKFVNELAGKSRMVNGQVQSIGVAFEDVVGVISKGAAALGIAFSAQQFVTQVARTRGEFQQLEVAFTTMLGSAEKASNLMSQLTTTAAVTPFGLQDVAKGAKSLLAYGVEAEKVNDTLVRLGDIASGLSIPLNDLVYLYGTTMTQGQMFTQDLRQFQGRGIPLADELAKQFGVTKDRVGELVTAGKVGFAELEKAIVSMTSEGGKFGGLMEAQSKTIIGQWSNIQDAIDGMFNEIGKSQEGVINTALQGVSLLVENYEAVGRSILALVATYGTYKAALITTIVLHKSWAVAARVDAAAKVILTAATKAQTVAQLALNAAMKANPAVLLATAVVGLGTAMWALSDHTSAAEKGLQEYNAEQEKFATQQKHAKQQLEGLVKVLNDENAAYGERDYAMKQMKALYPDLAQMFMDEKGQISDLTGLWEAYGKKAKEAKINSQEAKVAGLSTELSIAQNNYNTAKGNSNWGAAKKYKEQVENITAQLTQAKKDLSALTEEQKKAESQPEVKNKSYWEKKKKDAEDARDALDETKKNSKEWLDLEEQILEADKKLQQWDDPTKRGKKDDTRKKKEEDKNKELLKIARANEEARIEFEKEATKKREAQIELNYKKEIDAYEEAKKKYGSTKEVEAMKTIAEEKRENDLAELRKDNLRRELTALYDYLKEYGTIQEQKYAIAKEYDLRIAEEHDKNRKMLLQREKEQAVASIDARSLAVGIDWGEAFVGVGNVLKETARETLRQVEEYIKTTEFKNLSAENKKTYIDLRDKLRQETGEGASSPFNFKQWGTIAQQVTEYQNSVKQLQSAQKAHTEALNRLQQAEDSFAKATDDSSKAIAQTAIDIAKEDVDVTGANQKKAEENVVEAKDNLSNSTNAAALGISNFASYLNEMSSGSLYGFANGVTKLITSLGKGSDGVGKALGELGGKVGGIVGAILQILDALGDDPKQFIDDLLRSVADAVSNLIADLPSIVVTILERVVDIVGGIIGGIGSWFGLENVGESDKDLQKDIERLSASNDNLKDALNNLSDKLEKSSVADATGIYNQQVANLKETIKNTQEMMLRSAQAYSNGFLGVGGNHSSAYYVNQGVTYGEWGRISKIVGKTVRDADDFFNLTSEQMALVATEATDLYSKIEALANDGHKDASQYMDEYIQYYKQLEELENEWREKLTGSSFESVRDEFKNAMMDMESSVEDFAESFEDIMRNAIIEALMTSKYDSLIQKWYKDFAKAMEDGDLTKLEKRDLQESWNNIVNSGLADREALESLGLISNSSSYSQEASSKGFEAMNQDTASELNGRFTALQIAGEEIRRQSEQQTVLQTLISTDTAAIKQDMAIQKQYISEIVDIQYESVGYLAEINKNTKQLFQMNERLGKIEENTRNM